MKGTAQHAQELGNPSAQGLCHPVPCVPTGEVLTARCVRWGGDGICPEVPTQWRRDQKLFGISGEVCR